ncbi:MAG: isochorismate synthase MenF [Oligoflexales bacterium]
MQHDTLDERALEAAFAKLARIDEIRFFHSDDFRIAQYELVLESSPPIETLLPKRNREWMIVWKPKGGDTIYAGLGALLHFSYLDVLRFPEGLRGLRIFGGTPFPSEKNKSWLELNQSKFFLPEVEWVVTEQKTKARIRTLLVGEFAFEEIKSRLFEVAREWLLDSNRGFNQQPEVASAVDNPDFEEWNGVVTTVKDEISRGRMGKVVLGRSKNLMLSVECDFRWVVKRLLKQVEASYVFALQAPSGVQFFGRSPERFLAWENEKVWLDALAGTSQNTTAEGAEDLKGSDKDKREHGFVTMFIESILKETCSRFDVRKKQEVLKLAHVQHLASEYSGHLKNGVHPVELMGRLYPNPAVGGYPKNEAVSFLNAVEPLERGWYTGIIGWTDGVQGDFALGIRSALAYEKRLKIFGGAGIVSDSDANEEWRETGMKMKNMLEIFGYVHESTL